MDFINEIIIKSKSLNKRIVLPETDDERVLKAAAIILKEKITQVVLIGDESTINNKASELNIDLSNATIYNHNNFEKFDKMVAIYQKKREKKGMTLEKSREILSGDKMFFGAMLTDMGYADGLVGGAQNTTAHTLRAIIQCVGTKEGSRTISSFFAIISPKKEFGHEGIMFFGDCGVIPQPTQEQLADIAEATSDNYKYLVGVDPVTAFLSFSTKGSAKTEQADYVVAGLEILKERRPDINSDGEMQFDAAVIPEVAEKKAPGSKVAGNANVLIFPNLDAGNIGYKLAQRLGGCIALGPLLQGAKKPVNDLSRGCSVDDIVQVTAITAVQAGI